MTVLATIIVLGVLIFVHELGHFAAAKAVGVEVQRFSIGLGPKILGFTRGETEYVISAIPLGGYVKMGGMDDEVMERVEGGAPGAGEPHPDAPPARVPSDRDFDAKPIWARTLVISAGVIMNMLFAFALFTFIAAYWGQAHVDTTRVGQVRADLLPPGAEGLAELQPGSELVALGGEPVGNWSDWQEGVFTGPAGPTTLTTRDPEQTIAFVVPESEEQRVRLLQSVQYWVDAGVGAVDPGSPADRAGLEAGDEFVAVDGNPVANWWEFVREIEARPDQRTEVSLIRDGRPLTRTVTVGTAETETADGEVRTIGRIGILQPAGAYSYENVPMSEALRSGYRETVGMSALILGFLRDLVTGGVSPRQMGSIVTIGEASGQAAEAGLDSFLRFMAFFSINLAVLNLLPIPILDGGHLVFLAYEAVRGKAMSVEWRLRWSNVGFVVIMGIMLWALSNDFLRLLGL